MIIGWPALGDSDAWFSTRRLIKAGRTGVGFRYSWLWAELGFHTQADQGEGDGIGGGDGVVEQDEFLIVAKKGGLL